MEVTQEGLAWASDLNKGYLSQVEAGKRLPSIPVLARLAEGLKVELADLLVDPDGADRFKTLEADRLSERRQIHVGRPPSSQGRATRHHRRGAP
jgi:transcriptional regulator with XRE-family HTH domain